MKNRFRRIVALLRIEIGVSYRYPIIEGLVILIFLMPLWTLLSLWFDITFQIDDFDKITYAVIGFSKRRFSSSLIGLTGWLAIIIPVLSSFAIAKSFEDGYVQTLVTYPIDRIKLMLVKFTLVILIPAITFTAMLLFASLVAFPELPILSDVVIILLGAWVSIFFFASFTSLIAVTSKKVSTTAILGISYAFVTSFLQNISTIPNILRVVLNPLNGTVRFIADSAANIVYDVESMTTLIELQFGFSISLIIAIILLTMNLWVLRRSEI
ncbi:MAG: hypothetical protein ACTSUO_02705 [Candidatus Thorarchaeota archaeon]